MIDLFTAYFWIATCVYHEARGETVDGKIAVAQVIQNRAIDRHLTVEDVVKQDQQFSWYNGGKRPAIKNYDAFIRSARAVFLMLLERLSGGTLNGADHYYSIDIPPPWWTKKDKMVFITQIGKHRFYRWDG